MINHLEDLLVESRFDKKLLIVIGSHDEDVLGATLKAKDLGLVNLILIGDREKTLEICETNNFHSLGLDIIDIGDLEKASEIGVKLVSEGNADFIMKGLVDTSTLLKAVLNKEWGLRTNSLLSHLVVYEVDTYKKLLYVTDGGMNISPSAEQKTHIINNASLVAKALGNRQVKVACLAAKEKVDSKMKATTDAAEIKKLYLDGYFEEGIIIDGPMALDLAISKKAAETKNYKSEVAGDADILLMPNIEMGNGIGKSITYFGNGKSAGIVMGARVPIILTSRADTMESKLYSIALGNIIANYNKI